jgi:hypothetical protein
MSLRRTLLVACLLAFPFVFAAAAGAAKPDRPSSSSGPTNLRITASTDTSASLSWDAANGGSSNWWYCVQRDGLGCFRVDPPSTTITFTRLWPGSTFNWSVITVSSTGKRSAPSNTVTFTTPPDTTPPTPPTLSVTGVWPTRVAVSWTNSTDNATGVSYTFLSDGGSHFPGEVALRSVNVLDLEPGSTHSYTVLARDAFGNTAESNTVTVTTPTTTDASAPTAPLNLRLGPEGGVPEIWLDWDPSTDETDTQAELLYEIYLNGIRDHRVIGGTDTIAYCTGEGPNTITVKAVDTSGNRSASSNAVVFC